MVEFPLWGPSLHALVDTGATISVVLPDFISVGQRQDTRTTLIDAGGKEIIVEGTTIVELEIGNYCTYHAMIIAAMQDLIIGQGVIRKHGCVVDWKTSTFNIADTLVSMRVPRESNEGSSQPIKQSLRQIQSKAGSDQEAKSGNT